MSPYSPPLVASFVRGGRSVLRTPPIGASFVRGGKENVEHRATESERRVFGESVANIEKESERRVL